MSETLPPDVRQFVQQAIANGEYATEDEVITQAVRVLRDITERHQKLRADVQAAVDEVDAGKGEPWNADEIKAELDEQLDANAQTN